MKENFDSILSEREREGGRGREEDSFMPLGGKTQEGRNKRKSLRPGQ